MFSARGREVFLYYYDRRRAEFLERLHRALDREDERRIESARYELWQLQLEYWAVIAARNATVAGKSVGRSYEGFILDVFVRPRIH